MFTEEKVLFDNPSKKQASEKNQKENKDDIQKLQELVTKTRRVLFAISSFFPFDIFPDSIVLDETKVTITTRNFFLAKQEYTFPYEDILDITVEASVLFATLRIFVEEPKEPFTVRHLKKEEALRAKHMLEGLRICIKEGVDIIKIPTEKLVKDLEEIGRGRA